MPTNPTPLEVASNPDEESLRHSGLEGLLEPRLFKALGDPTRVAILLTLAQSRDGLPVGEVAARSPVDVSVVSRHLAVLREAGIVECERQGKVVFYWVRYGALTASLRALADAIEQCCPPEGVH
jgi:ArsR family transcriptional regulator|tara:strand:- start:2537 stop:2908 length:372 start_codon:yes stop_codon:yes gene_type:complete